MPNYDTIDGIKIDVYSTEHVPPHVHAIYNEDEALIEIETLNLYAGALPPKQLKKAVNYIRKNQEDLLETFYQLNERLRPNETDTENR